jgi:CarboxypepD_reg-like domain
MIRFIFAINLVLLTLRLTAQPTQTIRGTVIDHASNTPIVFASIALLNTNPLIGASTDSLGNFTISNVPLGRCDLKVTCVGYEPAVQPQTHQQNGNFGNGYAVRFAVEKIVCRRSTAEGNREFGRI